MKKRTMAALFVLIFTCIQCKNSTQVDPLPTDKFNYNEQVYSIMDELSSKSTLLNLDDEQVIVRAKTFSVTNRYVIPFLYFQLMNMNTPLEQIQKEDIEEIMMTNAMDRALNHALFIEASRKFTDIPEDDVSDQLAIMSNGNIDQFREYIEQLTPFTWDFILDEARAIVTIERYKEEIIQTASAVSEKKIEKFYKENPEIQDKPARATVRHILKVTEGLNESEKSSARLELEAIRQRIVSGENFAELATRYSQDPGSSAGGGLVGDYIEQGQTIDEFDAIAFSQPVGEVSTVFETAYGYHILLVESRNDAGKWSLEDLHDRIEAMLVTEEQNNVIDKEIERIKKSYSIKEMVTLDS
jgi:parvulin-like peptidyl-prolyl isomerase